MFGGFELFLKLCIGLFELLEAFSGLQQVSEEFFGQGRRVEGERLAVVQSIESLLECCLGFTLKSSLGNSVHFLYKRS